ncbi:MAG: thioredoxin domain-containing protein [bacterium]|nr:thioredoxin domain-containing protein [bacterium]
MDNAKFRQYQIHKEEKLAELKVLRWKKLARRLGIWSLGFLFLGGAGFGMVRLATAPKSELLLASAVSATDQSKGNKESLVVLAEYSDFQCPACATYYPVVEKIIEEFGDKIQFVYRHFPLPQHQQAKLAAYAAEAAGRQGKFWEMHDLIFGGQKDWAGNKDSQEIFENYAKALKLDLEKFKQDLDSEEIKEKVNNDYKSGLNSGVNSTPTFFLNGKQLQNPRSYEEFQNIIFNATSNF